MEEIKSNDSIIRLTPLQRSTYKGLKQIGSEIAAFYLDGVRIYNNPYIKTKTSLLAHIAREIDGGLRGLLESKTEKKKIQKEIKKYDLDDLKDCKGHVASILSSINDDDKSVKDILDTPIAKKWINTATIFAKLVHRHGIGKKPRDFSEIKNLWDQYEDILYFLVGSYINLIIRIDKILKIGQPTKDTINVLKNLTENNTIHFYFFKNLKSEKWIIPLKNASFFDPKNNPNPYKDPDNPDQIRYTNWAVLYYLERIAKLNAENPKDEISDTLEKIVDDIIKNRNKNIYTDWNISKIISLFPNDKIKKEYIQFVGDILKSDGDPLLIAGEIEQSFLPKLIEVGEKEILLEFLKLVLNYKEIKKDDRIEYKPILESYYYDRSIKKYKKEIAKICGIDTLQLGVKKIKEFIEIDEKEFSKWRINTIEDHVQNFSGERYSFQIVSFVKDMLENLSPDIIIDLVKNSIKEKHSIFQRLAMYAINHHYDDLNHLFWEWKGNPLNLNDAKLEIYELLKSNCEKFGNKETERLVNWIENGDYFTSEEAKEDQNLAERQITYRKKEWLTGVEKNNHPKIKEKLDKYNKIVPEKVDHPGYDRWVATWSGVESDVNVEKIKDMSCEAIVEFLKTPIEDKKYGRINEEGRADALREAIKGDPDKFYNCFDKFVNIDLIYQSKILRAYEEIWKDGKDIDWERTFSFIVNLIYDKNFWRKKAEWHSTDYRRSAIYFIIQLIENGSRNDSRVFDPKYLLKAEAILLELSNHISTTEEPQDMGDMASTVVNSELGQLFEAMVVLALRYARVYKKEEKDKKERWLIYIKEYFNDLLHKGDKRQKEFSFILGQFLPNLMFLDEFWIKENLKIIFLKEFEEQWEWFFSGYLYYSNTVYDGIYKLLKKHGNYSKAIKTKFTDNLINEKLVQHIAIGYGQGWESLDDKGSLLNQLLSEKRPDQLRALIEFFSSAEKEDKDLIKKKLKPLWAKIIELIKGNIEEKEFQEIAAALTQWVNLVDKIDEDIFKYLKFSVKYLGNNFYGRQFMEFLYTYVNNYPEETGQFYLKMIESGAFPSFEQKKIIYIIEFLYKKNIKKEANKICNIYAENGFFYLNDLYNKYNK